MHHSNTYWVPVDVVLETIGIADLKKKLVARHFAMRAHLLPTRCECPVAADSGGRLVRDVSAKRGMQVQRVVLSQAVQLPEGGAL